MKEMYIDRGYASSGDGKSWFWIIILLLLISVIGIIWSNRTPSLNTCDYTGCTNPATTNMKSPISGTIRPFCDEHAAVKAGQNWEIVGPTAK